MEKLLVNIKSTSHYFWVFSVDFYIVKISFKNLKANLLQNAFPLLHFDGTKYSNVLVFDFLQF